MANQTVFAPNRRTLLSTLGLSALLPTAALAQMMPSPDRFRVMELMGGEFAIQTSRLALERSKAQRVRDFAQVEIQEQTGIAASFGAVPGTTPLRPDQAAIVRRLSSLQGPVFDHAYIEGQIAGHQELLALNSDYASTGLDPFARAVAAGALPLIQAHLAWLTTTGRG